MDQNTVRIIPKVALGALVRHVGSVHGMRTTNSSSINFHPKLNSLLSFVSKCDGRDSRDDLPKCTQTYFIPILEFNLPYNS